MTLSACGGDDDSDDGRPDDFSFVFQHVDGSTPPPFHAEWTIEVDANGSGSASYVPDYAGDDVPLYSTDLQLDADQLDSIYEDMRDAGLLEDIEKSDDPPIGGSIETAAIMADGKTYVVPAFDDSGGAPIAEVSDAIVALVPEDDWATFEEKRDAYAQREYGEKP